MAQNIVYNVHEGYAEHQARRKVNEIGKPFLGAIMIILGLIGIILGITSEDMSVVGGAIIFGLIGIWVYWSWFRDQDYYGDVLKKSREAPIQRVSYG